MIRWFIFTILFCHTAIADDRPMDCPFQFTETRAVLDLWSNEGLAVDQSIPEHAYLGVGHNRFGPSKIWLFDDDNILLTVWTTQEVSFKKLDQVYQIAIATTRKALNLSDYEPVYEVIRSDTYFAAIVSWKFTGSSADLFLLRALKGTLGIGAKSRERFRPVVAPRIL